MQRLDAARKAAGIKVKTLCEFACTWPHTYYAGLAGRHVPQRGTLIRLGRALARLQKAQPKPVPAAPPAPEVIAALYRAALIHFAREHGLDAAAALATPIASRSNFDAANARLGCCRMLAFYLTVNAFSGVTRGQAQRVVGYSKQAASKALRSIEDRRDDPAFDAIVNAAARALTGRDMP